LLYFNVLHRRSAPVLWVHQVQEAHQEMR